jgi:hypothetical protein
LAATDRESRAFFGFFRHVEPVDRHCRVWWSIGNLTGDLPTGPPLFRFITNRRAIMATRCGGHPGGERPGKAPAEEDTSRRCDTPLRTGAGAARRAVAVVGLVPWRAANGVGAGPDHPPCPPPSIQRVRTAVGAVSPGRVDAEDEPGTARAARDADTVWNRSAMPIDSLEVPSVHACGEGSADRGSRAAKRPGTGNEHVQEKRNVHENAPHAVRSHRGHRPPRRRADRPGRRTADPHVDQLGVHRGHRRVHQRLGESETPPLAWRARVMRPATAPVRCAGAPPRRRR